MLIKRPTTCVCHNYVKCWDKNGLGMVGQINSRHYNTNYLIQIRIGLVLEIDNSSEEASQRNRIPTTISNLGVLSQITLIHLFTWDIFRLLTFSLFRVK